MRFFAKIVFVCNLCFVTMLIFHFVEKSYSAKANPGQAIPLPFIEGSIAVLGELAIIANIFFCTIALVLVLMKKIKQIPIWIVIFNFIILMAQIYWFFIDNS